MAIAPAEERFASLASDALQSLFAPDASMAVKRHALRRMADCIAFGTFTERERDALRVALADLASAVGAPTK